MKLSPPPEIPENHTLARLFHDNAERYSQDKVLRFKKNGHWKSVRWAALQKRVWETARGLLALKLKKQETVAILAENSPWWVTADLGALTAGGVTVPIYATNTPQQVAHVLKDSGAKWVFVSTEQQLGKVLAVAEHLPQLKKIITFSELPKKSDMQMSLAQLWQKGEAVSQEAADAALGQITSQDLATLIYTSGATGEPKGVMLTHGAILSNLQAIAMCFPLTRRDVGLSFLPLSHSFERTAGYYLPLMQGAQIAFSERLDTVMEDLPAVRPTVMTAVPRFYEKFYAAVRDEMERRSAVDRALLHWSVEVGLDRAERRQDHRLPAPWLEGAFQVARLLVMNALREKTGGKLRFFVSGGAPLAQEVVEFFHAAGLPIYEGYGLTEAGPVLTVNRPGAFRFGTVGRALPGVQIEVAADGEILAKGPNLMRGYFNQPQDTADVLQDGWLHTGDLGRMDAEGFLHLTGRKKDILITAGGKNVAPQRLEGLLMTDPLVDQAVVVGDGRKYLAALLAPDSTRLLAWAREQGLAGPDETPSLENLIHHPAVITRYQEIINHLNHDLPSYETLKQFTLLPRRLTMEADEITPTLKIRRHVVQSRYYAQIEAMYPDNALPTDE